jgi:O-acetyl-ADP-ribose deacetylase (regulator of RNase III)
LIKIVKGDILQAKEDIIGHQVNCKGIMGAGLAKQIRNKYPIAYSEYKELCLKQGDRLLGATQYIDTLDGKVIVNIFGQMGYGRNRIQTDYKALEMALKSIKYTVTETTLKNKSVALPYGIGCGLAGGDWDIVHSIISDVFNDYEITLYKL